MDFKTVFSQLRKEEQNPGLKIGLGQALFGKAYWFQSVSEDSFDHEEVQEVEEVQEIEPVSKSETEKVRTLSSLENFAKKKVEESGDGEAIKFKGGELKVKTSEELLSTANLNHDLPELKTEGKIKALFLGDTFQLQENPEHEVDLLGKMIEAMKLTGSDFLRVPYQDSDYQSEEFKNIAKVLGESRPDLIITLGAVATNNLMGKKERLSRVHGKIFSKTFTFNDSRELNVNIMPVFHPDFLKINPNMKRAAWIDLQKAMEFLGLS